MRPATCRLYTASISVAFGCGFLIYSTYVTNNIQVVGEEWVNASVVALYGCSPSPQSISLLWASVIASKEVGKVVGTLLIPLVAERLGRRGGLLANCLLTFFGCFLAWISLHLPFYFLMIARFCLGVSMIMGVGLGSMYLIEVAPTSARGVTGALIQIFRGFGGTMGMVFTLPDIMGTPELWTLALALPAVPTLLQFIVLLFSPESPRHLLITAGEEKKAEEAVRFYQGPLHVDEVMKDLVSERQRIRLTTEKMGCWRVLRKSAFLRPIGLTVLALTNRSLAGILPVQTYSTDMFISTGLTHGAAAYSTVGLGLCHLVSAIAVTFSVERRGRRQLLLAGNIACLISLSAVALFSHVSINSHHVGAVPRVLTVMSLGAFMLVYPVVASVSNIVASELCHQNVNRVLTVISLGAFMLVYPVVASVSNIVASELCHQNVNRVLTVMSLGAFMLVYPVVASVSNIVASELCHQKIRSAAFTVGLLAYSLVGFISTFAYPLLKRYMGLSWSYFPSCLSLIMTILIYYVYLPETRGKSFETLFFEVEEVCKADMRPLLFGDGCALGSSIPTTSEEEEEEEHSD